MRDYWLTKDLLQAAGIGFVLLALIGIGLALWLPKKWWGKLLAVLAVGFVTAIPIYKAIQESQQQQVEVNDYKERLTKAQALFDERCKTAEVKVYKTVDGVDGVSLLNIRQYDRLGVADNPLWPDAALPLESGGDDYIRYFLYQEYDGSPDDRGLAPGERGYLSVGVSGKPKVMSRGYRFVDVKQADGSTLRYRLKEQSKPDLVSEPVKGTPARYAVGFVNDVNPDDRAHWVAGTVITLTDTQTNEIVAKRASYSFEPGLGSKAGGRQPWRFAVTCPANSIKLPSEHLTRFFVDQILKPKQGE
jgi:hypothetical protein